MEDTMDERDEEMTVTISLDEGDVECGIFTILTVEEKDYIALFPMVEEDNEYYGEVWLYRFFESENLEDEPELEYIDNDAEYDLVATAFEEYVNASEFDEIIEEDAE